MAKRKISTETAKVDDMIRSVAELQIQAASDREMAERLLRQAEADKGRIAEQEKKLKDKEQTIISKAREEAAVMLAKAKKETAEIIKDLRRLQLEPGSKGIEAEIRSAQDRFSLAESEIETVEELEPLSEALTMVDIKPGMEVFIRKLQQSGEVIQVQNRQNTVEVQIGALKLSVPLEEIAKPKEAKMKSKKKESRNRNIGKETVSSGLTEIDLRGQTVTEAMEILEKYLDSAILSGTPKVNIIHGKGTGALRDAIRKQLPQLPGIKSIRPGETGEGGDGVTVVYFSEMV
jgi:DNA mismatch repair protein MutS2